MIRMPRIHSAGTFDGESHFPAMACTPERVLDRYELELFVQDGGVSILNGQEYPIRRGMLLVAKPGDRRQSKLPFCIRFIRVDGVDETLSRLLNGILGVMVVEKMDMLETSFRNISTLFVSDDLYQRVAATGELLLLVRTIHHLRLHHPAADAREMDVIATAQRYIEQHYREEMSVEELARACNVSTPYLHRLFAVQLKTTPHNMLMQRRIMAAKAMLISDPCPISEVAWRCGFQSASYFSDCFRRWAGVSPRQFRKEIGYQI